MPLRAPVLLLFDIALVLSVLMFAPAVGHGATLYVDGRISAPCTSYAPASRSCSGGSARAYRAVAGAAAAAVAGDTVYVRGGTYSGQLAPARSGTATLPITFAAYAGEKPILYGSPHPALWLIHRSYIVVDGLTVSKAGGWGRLEYATHNTIRNCTFTVATFWGSAGGLKLVRSTYNKILDNTFNNGNDNITVQESDRNVIQGNMVSTGRHSLLSLRCGNYNVVRGNTFSNPKQKNLEIYDCEGTSDAPIKLNATKRNLVENNVIANTHSASTSHDYNGIQFGGQQGIVRRNVFRDDLGGGINFQYYAKESLYNNRNRVYHNTFYNNRCYGIVGNTGNSTLYYDNRARNNILYKNASCSGAPIQTSITNSSRVMLSDNAVVTTSPGFVNEAARDLRLAPGSPMIDAAAFLVTTTVAGSGTRMTVTNATYFFDGYGIPGELGDEIQLQGQTAVARVVAVDLAANRLTLDRSLSWAAGTGVALRYDGARPDLGAYESTGGGTTPPQLTVVKAGNGTGTVTSSPAGISCGTDCSEAYNPGTIVTLSPSAAAGSSFAGWSGACTGTGSCQVTMSAAQSVTAAFKLSLLSPYTLTVARSGGGKGTVTSSPAGINCGTDCSQSYNAGTLVTLSPTAAPGSSFAGWSGACYGTSSCRVTMAAARSVTATFNTSTYALIALKAGTGAGIVSSSPAGIYCGSHCSQSYQPGTVVTLRATVAAGSSFVRWTGACYGTGPCLVTMAAAKSVTATFNRMASTSSVETSSATTPPPGDFDGDGKPDLLWHNQRTGQLKTWLLDRGSMKADPDITPDGLADTSWQVRGLADFNGDGHSDILWQHLQTGELRVWLMNQTSLVDDVELTTRRLGFGWQIGGVADFNGDGKADILWHDQRRGALYVWLMDATTAVAGAYITAEGNPDTSWQINGLADFNGDGEADILWRHKRTGDLHVWFMKGTKAAGESDLLPARIADWRWRIARLADLNEDGQTDVLWHNRNTGELIVWYMNGVTMTSFAPLDPSQFTETDWTVAPEPDVSLPKPAVRTSHP